MSQSGLGAEHVNKCGHEGCACAVQPSQERAGVRNARQEACSLFRLASIVDFCKAAILGSVTAESMNVHQPRANRQDRFDPTCESIASIS